MSTDKEIQKAPNTSKGTFGKLATTCVFCKKTINKHRSVKIRMIHSPIDGGQETQIAAIRYTIPLCEEHSGLNKILKKDFTGEEQLRVKLSWEHDEPEEAKK